MRLFAPLALAAALFLGACQNPDGSVNVPGTIALGAGVALAGLAVASANNRPDHDAHRRHYRGYRGDDRRYGRRYRHW